MSRAPVGKLKLLPAASSAELTALLRPPIAVLEGPLRGRKEIGGKGKKGDGRAKKEGNEPPLFLDPTTKAKSCVNSCQSLTDRGRHVRIIGTIPCEVS